MHKAIFLDRDGVINASVVIDGKPHPPENLKQLQILPGVKGAVDLFKQNGFLCIIITNQPDVARGKLSLSTVEEMNDYLVTVLDLDDCFCCYHDDKDCCLCRKPKPGSILNAAQKYNINLNESYMVGDRWRDIEAGQNAGCRTIFIDYHYDEKYPLNPTHTVQTLFEAANLIVNN
jgi:D-glycero-D-manno-heptose 1,7-bisphosphate phosphatase